MNYPVAVFTADNHLRRRTWVKHPDLVSDAYVSFRAIVDRCLELSVPLFLGGDTFDAVASEPDAVVFFSAQVARMHVAGLNVYYVTGNHDRAATPWPEVHNHCTHLDRRMVQLAGFRIHGLDFRPAGEIQAALAELPMDEIDLLLLHQSWKEIQRVGHVDAAFTDLPACERMPILVTGDYHVHGLFTGVAASGQPVTAYSPGSTCMQQLNESPEKFYYVLTTGDAAPEMVAEPLPTRPYLRLECRDEVELVAGLDGVRAHDTSYEHLPEEIRRPILHVRFDDRIPDAYARIVQVAAGRFHLFDDPRHVTDEILIDTAGTPDGAFDDLLSALAQLAPPGSDNHDGARRLVEAAAVNRVPQEIDTMFREYMSVHDVPREASCR